MKFQLNPAELSFEGKGTERRSLIEIVIEGVIAGVCLLLSYTFLAVAYGENAQVGVSLVLYFGAILMVLARRRLAVSRPLAVLDFRLVEMIQDVPFWWLRFLTLIGFALLLNFIFLKLFSPSWNLGFVGALFLFMPLYYITRYYSSAGFARVYLLQFLKERRDSDERLASAAKALNKSLNSRGLRVEPYDFRAGANLGLMRRTLDEAKLRELADLIVNLGKEEDNKLIRTMEEILQEVGTDAKILPLRPVRDRISVDHIAKIVGVIAGGATVLAIVFRLILGVQIPFP